MERMEPDDSSTGNMNGGDWISIGDMFSEESSFAGDAKTKTDLERRAAVYDPKEYWSIQAWNLQCLSALAAARLPPRGTKRKRDDSNKGVEVIDSSSLEIESKEEALEAVSLLHPAVERPYNPYEGQDTAKQLMEPLEDFLSRLPPSTTNPSSDHWIRVANPSSNYRPSSADTTAFKKAAQDPMESYLSTKANLERDAHWNGNLSTVTRKLKPDRDELERTIIKLAKQYGVIKGKWMLFPSSDKVDQAWATVARMTIEGTLGCAAKVAVNNEDDSRNDQRLLCVYTDDFSDVTDVKRVLRELYKSELVIDHRNGSKGGIIYYKCDAYTHLDIVHGNEFKIRASMYNSKDMFAEMKKKGEM